MKYPYKLNIQFSSHLYTNIQHLYFTAYHHKMKYQMYYQAIANNTSILQNNTILNRELIWL